MHFKRIVSLLTATFFLSQFPVFAQDSAAVKWQATGKKIAVGQYEIKLTGTIKSGWHVYAKSNIAAGLEGFKITFSDSAIQKTGDQQVTGNTKTIADKIFETQTEVVENNLVVLQKINLSGFVVGSIKQQCYF